MKRRIRPFYISRGNLFQDLQTRLFDALRQLQRYEEAYKVLLGILDKENDNQGLLLVGGQVAVQANDLDLCQRLWKKAATMENESLAEKVSKLHVSLF